MFVQPDAPTSFRLPPWRATLFSVACLTLVVPTTWAVPATQPATLPSTSAHPKNVIVLIADGAGYNMLQAVRLHSGAPLAADGPEWTKLALSTYALRRGKSLRAGLGALDQDPWMVYEPKRHFDTRPTAGEIRISMFGQVMVYLRGCAGYDLHRRTAPDSAATASAMMTGVTTFNEAINVDGARQPVESVAEIAKRAGKRVGVVTTVPWTHATPAAAAGAHNVSRDEYSEITREILDAGVVDVIAGAGHPGYDDNAASRDVPDYTFYGRADWRALSQGSRTDSAGARWTLVEDVADIRALATGPTPERLVIVPRVGWTLQQRRARIDRNGDGLPNEADAFHTAPGEEALNENLPTLRDLARAALTVIDDDPDGFFLVIEGGAVDWAMHDNQLGRAVEEYVEFDETVKLVCAYLDAGTNGHSWENTLVIVTADHDHLLYGSDAAAVPFQELQDRGKGQLPGHRWMFNSHSNNPVPFFARGAGSGRFAPLADESDEFKDGDRRMGRGAYLHQAEMGAVLKELVGPSQHALKSE